MHVLNNIELLKCGWTGRHPSWSRGEGGRYSVWLSLVLYAWICSVQ